MLTFPSHHPASPVVGGDKPPCDKVVAHARDALLDQLSCLQPEALLLRQEDLADRVLAKGRQLDAYEVGKQRGVSSGDPYVLVLSGKVPALTLLLAEDSVEEHVWHGHQDASAVAGVGLAAAGTSVGPCFREVRRYCIKISSMMGGGRHNGGQVRLTS